jgi:hypothetical protein
MADLKISQLTAITTLTPATDVLPVVDVTGTTKKITTNQILGSGGTATLASATISGDLTVDTNTLFVDAANNRVGMGTLTPVARLIVRDGANRNLLVASDASHLGSAGIAIGSFTDNAADWAPLSLVAKTSIAFGLNGSTAMTLNSTGLLIGTTATSYGAAGRGLAVAGGSSSAMFGLRVGSTDTGYLYADATKVEVGYLGVPLLFNNGAVRMTLDTSGNVGIGVTPSVGKGCLQLSSGINFPATQVASSDANTLDDYEEGTWTGTLKGSVSDPTTPVTATGKYTKIGRQVFVEITFNGVNTTGASGNITVTGLTFPCGSNINGVGVVSLNQIGTFTGSPYVFLSQSTSVLELYGNVSAGAGAAITHNAGALRYMTISLTYTV